MKTAWAVAFSVVCSFLVAGLILLVNSPPRGDPITLRPVPSPSQFTVQVAGAVLHPGLYSLPPGSRVQDAVQAAGGATGEGDTQSVNLAAQIQDGERIYIPSVSQPPQIKAQTTEKVTAQASTTAFPPIPVNINTATLEQLDTLPGIGPVIAARIIAYRDANGQFKAIEDLQNVSGIGQVTFDRLKDLICVEDPGEKGSQ